MSSDAKLSQDLLGTPADAWPIPTKGTAIAFRRFFRGFLNQVVAVILTQAAPRPCAVPEEAVPAIAGLLRGVQFLLHILTSNH